MFQKPGFPQFPLSLSCLPLLYSHGQEATVVLQCRVCLKIPDDRTYQEIAVKNKHKDLGSALLSSKTMEMGFVLFVCAYGDVNY